MEAEWRPPWRRSGVGMERWRVLAGNNNTQIKMTYQIKLYKILYDSTWYRVAVPSISTVCHLRIGHVSGHGFHLSVEILYVTDVSFAYCAHAHVDRNVILYCTCTCLNLGEYA